jgi:hypothetical protein
MEAQPELVMAMPRRELFRIQGFVPPNDVAVLESLAEESWFAAPALLQNDFNAKEVRLGIIAARGPEVLLDPDGVLLHATPIPPEVGSLGGSGLAVLRKLALTAARLLLGTEQGRVELVGFCNEDAMQECRGIFLLVYRFAVPDQVAAPIGMRWVARTALGAEPLDPVSALVLDAVR